MYMYVYKLLSPFVCFVSYMGMLSSSAVYSELLANCQYTLVL